MESTGDDKSLESGGGNNNQHHTHYLFQLTLRLIILFATVGLLCLALYHSAYPFQLLPSSFKMSSPKDIVLEGVLRNASMADKTVILTTLNEAWAEPNSIFDLFLEGFKIGHNTQRFLNHLVVIALDDKAYNRCIAIHPHCYDLSSNGIDFSEEANFMSSEYLKMMWRRIDFLRTVLNLGYNFIFTDADIMWFRDPFPHFFPKSDFEIACDYFRGDPSNLNNQPNGGFTYVKSNTRTTRFYEFWYRSRETYPGLHDQDVLNKIKYDPYIRKNGIKIKFLDTKYFGGICEPSRDFNQVCTMHANCCVGLANKIHDLKIMLDDWRKYTTRGDLQRSTWTVPQRCGAASFRHREPSPKNDTQGSKG